MKMTDSELCPSLQLPHGPGVSNLQCLVNHRAICRLCHWDSLLDGEYFDCAADTQTNHSSVDMMITDKLTENWQLFSQAIKHPVIYEGKK